jgi:hypothetical protein
MTTHPSQTDMNPKDKAGALKPQLGLLPVLAIPEVAHVLELGARKYGVYNWRDVPIHEMTYAHAVLRHIFAWIAGEDNDPESGRSHFAHAVAGLLVCMDARAAGTSVDDRKLKEKPKPTDRELEERQRAIDNKLINPPLYDDFRRRLL